MHVSWRAGGLGEYTRVCVSAPTKAATKLPQISIPYYQAVQSVAQLR